MVVMLYRARYLTLFAMVAMVANNGVQAAPTCAVDNTIYATCRDNADDQCQRSCCFTAGYCKDSSNNNCLVPNQLFETVVDVAGGKMSNHQSNEYVQDGCFCNTKIQDGGRSKCDPDKTSHCWGRIDCTRGQGFLCESERRCVVSGIDAW